MAYVKSRPGQKVSNTHQVWIRRVAASDPVLICEVPDPRWVRSPVWSPNGRMIALGASDKGKNLKQIWAVPLAGDGKPAAIPLR